MPFVAEQISTGKRICTLDFKHHLELRRQYQKGDMRCPHCQGAVHLVFAQSKRLFWRHNRLSPTCPIGGRETAIHLITKQSLVARIAQDSRSAGVSFEIEHRFPDVGQNGRIADVAVFYENGDITAYEIQISKISVDDLKNRTEDYKNQGIEVVWIFSTQALSSLGVLLWSVEEFCGAWVVELEAENHPKFSLLKLNARIQMLDDHELFGGR